MEKRRRYAWVDLLKAAGILAVVWIHVFQGLDKEKTLLIERLGILSRFAVPAFFLTSGFLQATSKRIGPRAFFTRQLERLLVPYLVASVAAILFRQFILGESFSAKTLLWMITMGDAWGIYYFVPLLVVTAGAGEFLFRFPRLAWGMWIGLTVLGILAYQLHFFAGSFAMELRNPLRWWGWFCGGWLLAVERGRIDALGRSARLAFGGTLLGLAACCYASSIVFFAPGWSRPAATLEYLMVEGLLMGVALAAWQGSNRPAVQWLSEASYPIYLQHYFFIVALERLAGWGHQPLAVLLVTIAANVISVITLSRVFGPRARLLFGTPKDRSADCTSASVSHVKRGC